MSNDTERRLIKGADVFVLFSVVSFGAWEAFGTLFGFAPKASAAIIYLVTILILQLRALLSDRAAMKCTVAGARLVEAMKAVHAAELASVGFEIRKCDSCGEKHPLPIDSRERPSGAVH